MAGYQRCLAAVASAVGVTAAALAFAAPGSTAPYVTAPTLSVSTTTPCKGAPLIVTGTDFVPGSTVTLTLHSADLSLGSVVVGAVGGFTTTVRIPVIGTHELVAAGPPTPRNTNTAEATVHSRSCHGPVPITGYSGGPAGGTSYALPAGLAALACLILGGVLVWWRRSRNHAA